MKKKYILNGKIYDEDSINEFAKKSSLSIDDYIKESGAKEHNDTGIYTLNGKDYDGNTMAEFAQKSDMKYDEYLKESGAKKKVGGEESVSNGPSEVPSTENKTLVPESPQRIKPLSDFDVIRQRDDVTVRNALSNTNPVAVSDMIHMDKPFITEDKEDREAFLKRKELKEQNIKDAIDNTTDRRLKSKGIKATKGSALYNQERAKTQMAYDNGFVKLHKHTDKDTGEETLGLDRTIGWYEGLTKGWNEAVHGNEEADAFVNMTNKERVDFLKEKHLDQPQPFGLIGEQYNNAGSVGNLLGGAGPTTVKAATGAVVGTGLAALAPETGGVSLAGLPTVMAYAWTAPDMIKHGMMTETIRRYQELKNQHPEMNDEEAMSHAAQGGIPVGGIVGAGENAILMGEGLKLPFSAESKTVLGGALKRSGKAALKFGTTTGVGTAAEQVEGNVEGIKTKPQEILNNSVNSAMDNAGYGFALHALMSELPQLPKIVKSAAKYTLVNDGKLPEVQQALKNAASEGKIPEEKANEVVSDLQNYKMALDKTSDGLTPEAKASVAGLIQAKGNILEEMKTKDDSQHDIYKKKIEAIDQQIKGITVTNKPYQHEVDEVSGQPLEKPSFDDVAKKRVDDLADKISKGKPVEDVVDVKTEQHFPEELTKALNRITKEEKSKNKDSEKPNTELSDNIEKYLSKKPKAETSNIPNSQEVKVESKNETTDQSTQEASIPVTEKTGSVTDEPPPEAIPTASEGEESKTTGIRHDTLKKVADRLGLKPPERGTFLSPEEQTKRGRLLLQGGVDPMKVAEDFTETGKATADEVSVARAHFENLTKEAENALDKYGKNSPEFAKAKLEVQKWQDEVQKPMATASGASFSAHQGENDLDTGSYVATKMALEDKQGKPLNAAQEKTITELTGKVKTLTEHSKNLEKQLIEATDKEKGTTKKENFETKARRIADKILKSETPSWLKINDSNIKKQGIGEAEVKKLLADATIKMGKLLDKGVEYSKAAKEAVEDLIKHFGEDRRDEIEKGFSQHFKDNQEPTKEEKNIKRLEKELSDLQQNKAKQKSPKRELTDREKQLQEQIKDERERMGLVASKMEKPLSAAEQREADEKELESLQTKFVDKKDNKFTKDESKEIWEYAKKNYIDKGVKYVDALSRTANDIGLSIRQVAEALTTPENKKQSDALWKKQHDIRNGQNAVKQYVENQNKNPLLKIWKKITSVPRALVTALHGHIFAGTHYPMGLVTPFGWGNYFRGIGQMWKSAYGSIAKHEQSVRELENDKNYVVAKKAGLENDPTHVGIDDYEKSGKILGKLGATGTRGFFGLKLTRQLEFNRYWDNLKTEDKTPEAAKTLAWLINNSTGATNLKIPAAIQEGLFSAGMESARWGRFIRNPAEAAARGTRILADMAKGVKIRPEDKVFVKVWGSRVGQQLATMTGLLMLNAYTQSKLNPKNPVNLTDPSKPDFFKAKFGDVDVDLSGGVLGAKNLLVKSGNYAIKDKSYKQEIGDVGGAVLQYLRGKLSPAYSDISELPLGTDYSGNILPFSSKKVPDGKRKIGWTEYLTSKVAPIFIQDVIKNIYEGAEENGVPKSTTEKVINGLIQSGLSFGYGVHTNPSYENNVGISDKNSSEYKFLQDHNENIKPYSRENLEPVDAAGNDIKVTDEKYKEFLDKREELIKEQIKNLREKGATYTDEDGDIKSVEPEDVKKITPDELKSWLMSTTTQADKDAITEVFGGKEKQKTPPKRTLETVE